MLPIEYSYLANIYPHFNIRPDIGFMNEVFAYDVRNLNSTDSKVLSQYIIALSQYLIFIQNDINIKKASSYKKKKHIEDSINQVLTKDILKAYSAKKDAVSYLISSNMELTNLNEEVELIEESLYLLNGVDKSLEELILSIKRELTRRHSESNLEG